MTTFARLVLLGVLGVAWSTASTADADWRGSPVYRGTWSSQTTGHQGTLRMRVLSTDGGTYRVRYTGTFLGVVPFVYSTPMTVTGRTADGGVTLYGQSRLPIFGEFTSVARMNGSSFSANYSSARDRGQFQMQRQ